MAYPEEREALANGAVPAPSNENASGEFPPLVHSSSPFFGRASAMFDISRLVPGRGLFFFYSPLFGALLPSQYVVCLFVCVVTLGNKRCKGRALLPLHFSRDLRCAIHTDPGWFSLLETCLSSDNAGIATECTCDSVNSRYTHLHSFYNFSNLSSSLTGGQC